MTTPEPDRITYYISLYDSDDQQIGDEIAFDNDHKEALTQWERIDNGFFPFQPSRPVAWAELYECGFEDDEWFNSRISRQTYAQEDES